MEINESLRGLFKQFCKAYGLKNVNENDPVLVRAFFDWIREEKQVKDEFYRNLLVQMGIDVDNVRCAEVGKTVNDSIVLPYSTKIITPCKDGLEEYKNRVIVANLKFHGNLPMLIQKGGHIDHAIPCDTFDKFITQNPYSNKEIANWENFPYQDIVVGVYGDVNDADRKNKLRQINEFYKRLDPRSMPTKESIIDDYNYASIVTTNRKMR